jgi:glycerate kinase
MVAALGLGSTRLVLALGGSASTDGGAGMLTALGVDFRDRNDHAVDVDGGSLRQIHSIDRSGLVDLGQVEIIIASDVENPLTGPDGAASVYGPQKGATAADVQDLDAGLVNLVHRLEAAGWGDAIALADAPGAGSAGGLGFAGMLLGGQLVSGAEFFLDLLEFDTYARGCDLVITGEGKLDSQTLAGKLLAVVTRRSRTVPVIAVVGHSQVDARALELLGIEAVYALSQLTDEDCARDPALSARLLEDLGRRIPLPTRTQRHTVAAADSTAS